MWLVGRLMDLHHEEYKYFFNTVDRKKGALCTALESDVLVWIACLDDEVKVDASLLGCEISFLFRYCGLRLKSDGIIISVENEFRSLGGQLQRVTQIQRSDGTKCAVGLSMTNYWSPRNDGGDFHWFVRETV